VERELIVRALDRFKGNQTHAAKYVDISRRTLIYRIEMRFDMTQIVYFLIHPTVRAATS